MAAEVISCPDCSRKLRVPENLLGQMVKCPGCGVTFTAPVNGASEPSPPGQVPYEEPPWDRKPLSNYAEGDPEEDRGDNGYEEVETRDEPRPSRRRRRRRPDDDDDDFPARRSSAVPGKVQAIAIMTLVGGIFGILMGLALAVTCYGLIWPGTYYSFVMGIMAVIKGSALLGQNAREESAPKTTAIMQIVNIINCDFTNCVMGILILVFLNEPEVRRYFRG